MLTEATSLPLVPELEDRAPAALEELADLEHPELYDLKQLMFRYYKDLLTKAP